MTRQAGAIASLCALSLTASIALVGPAHAAAWTQPQGQWLFIGDTYHTDSPKGFDSSGHVVAINGYHKTDATLYGEYGVTNNLTVFAQTGFESVTIDNLDKSDGLGYTDIGARDKLANVGNGVLSIQSSVRLAGSSHVNGPAQEGNTDDQIDVRALLGEPFKIAGRDGFIDLEGGYRLRLGWPPNEFHVDATLGYRPVKRLLLMAQAFNTISNGSGVGPNPRYSYYNAQLGAAYAITPRWTVQASWVATVYGQNALQERGFNLSVWLHL